MPVVNAQLLKDAADRWICPRNIEEEEYNTGAVVADLLARTSEWVSCQQSTSLALAVTLAEDHKNFHPGVRPMEELPLLATCC